MQSFFNTIQNCTALQDQSIKGKALLCAGNLAEACGADNFPQEALNEFTRFALECLQQTDSRTELKETAINYFSEISKILKSQMAEIIPVIVGPIIESCDTPIQAKTKGGDEAQGPEFDLDSDDSDDMEIVEIDMEGVDDQTSAIHCLGNLSLNCSGLMQPYLEQVCKKFQEVGEYSHENVRYHVCLSLCQIAFGQLRLALGKQDSDDKFEWQAGFPVQQ